MKNVTDRTKTQILDSLATMSDSEKDDISASQKYFINILNGLSEAGLLDF